MRVKQNPDKQYANEIKSQIKENNGYCPCKINKTPETKCICKEFKDMSKR